MQTKLAKTACNCNSAKSLGYALKLITEAGNACSWADELKNIWIGLQPYVTFNNRTVMFVTTGRREEMYALQVQQACCARRVWVVVEVEAEDEEVAMEAFKRRKGAEEALHYISSVMLCKLLWLAESSRVCPLNDKEWLMRRTWQSVSAKQEGFR